MDVKLLGLDETSSVVTIQAKLKLAIILFYISVVIDWRIPRKREARGGKL